MSEREDMPSQASSDTPPLQLTRIDIVLSSSKVDKATAYKEATAAGNVILDLGWAANNTIDVFFTLKGVTHDTKITRK